MLGVSVHAWFSNDELSLAPGGRVTLPLTVHNLGDETESYTIVPAGLTASWTTITPGNLTLFGGSQDVIDVTVAPPALPIDDCRTDVDRHPGDPARRLRRRRSSPRRPWSSSRSTTAGS